MPIWFYWTKGDIMEDLKKVTHICDLCGGAIEHHKNKEGEVYWNKGHNAQPVSEGRACNTCNDDKVIPARLAAIYKMMEPENAKIIKENFDIQFKTGVDDE